MCTLSNDYSLSISHSIFLRESVCMSEFRGHCSQLPSTFESIIWYLSIALLEHIIQYTDTKPLPPLQNTSLTQLSILPSHYTIFTILTHSHHRIPNMPVVATTPDFRFFAHRFTFMERSTITPLQPARPKNRLQRAYSERPDGLPLPRGSNKSVSDTYFMCCERVAQRGAPNLPKRGVTMCVKRTNQMKSPVAKLRRLGPNKGILSRSEEDDEVPRINVPKMRRELEKMKKPITWGDKESTATGTKMLEVEGGGKKKEETTMVNMDEKIDITQTPKPVPVLSFTGRSWEHSGYPNSLSFLI